MFGIGAGVFFLGSIAVISIIELLLIIFFLRKENKKLSKLATTDDLTGLTNKRGFDLKCGALVGMIHSEGDKRHINSLDSIGILFLDINKFKNINDTYGHTFGDKIIKMVADLVVCCIRSSDIACRNGGDEFLVALPGVNEKKALEVSELIYDKVVRFSRCHYDCEIKVSIGVAIMSTGNNLEEVIKMADLAMYDVKKRSV